MLTVLLVRHGESTWNREGRMQGWAPTELTEIGEKQSERTAEWLAEEYDIDKIVTSDIHRAVKTAEPLVDAVPDAEFEYDIRWREQDFGVYQGLTPERFQEVINSDDSYDDPTKPLDDGESTKDVRRRVIHGIEELHDESGTIVVVAHTGSITQAIGHLMGYDPLEAYDEIDIDNVSITELRLDEGGEEIVRVNDTQHLADTPLDGG